MDVGINARSQGKILDGPSASLFRRGPTEIMTQLVFVPRKWVTRWLMDGWSAVYPDQLEDKSKRAVLMHPPGWGESTAKDMTPMKKEEDNG